MSKSKGANSNEFITVNDLGGGIKLLGREQVKLTAKFAKNFIGELMEFGGERNLRKSWATHLAFEMKRGTFRPEHVLLATAQLGEDLYRVNGQHTNWGRLEFKGERAYDYNVTLLRYKVETEEDLRNLYSAFDQHGVRTRGHVIMAQLVGYEGWANVARQIIQIVARGYPLYKWEENTERKKHDKRDIAYLLKTEDMELALLVSNFMGSLSGDDRAHLKRAPVVAAMLSTWNKAQAASLEFWEPVATGIGFSAKGDPRNKLRTELLTVSSDTRNGRTVKRTLNQEEMYRLCITQWNRWRNDPDARVSNVTRNFDLSKKRPTVK